MNDLNGVVGTDIVLINSFQPSNIVVSVRNQVNIELPRKNGCISIVCDEFGFRGMDKQKKEK